MYSFAPAYICSSYLLSSVFLYFLCVLISMGLHEKENDVFEEVLLLHSDSSAAYHASRELLQLGFCLLFALVLSLFPVLKAILQPDYFTRALTASDVLWGGGTILFCGICGTECGDLFHPRLIKLKYGICAVILLSVIAVCKQGLIHSFSAFRILDILMPPFMDSFGLLGNSDRFEPAGSFFILLHLLLYSLVLCFLKIRLLMLKKYRM